MRKGLTTPLFLCLALIQITVSLSMVIRRESVLKTGMEFKFRVAPVDPYDAFRGRYVALRAEENKVTIPAGEQFKRGERVYAYITLDEEGFAKISAVTRDRPGKGAAYIEAKVNYLAGENMHLDLPIDRYYMEERSAPAAEKLYMRYSGRNRQDAYVLVRVKDGLAVIESLYVGGKHIEEAVKSAQ